MVAVAAMALVMGAGVEARAADQDGLGGFFQRLFSPVAPSREAPVAVQPQQFGAASQEAYYGQPQALRPSPLPRARPEPLRLRVSDRQPGIDPTARQVPIDMKDGPVAAFMKDRTLQPGDIVVLNDGARVFGGQSDRPRSLRDFESVGRSDFIDRGTRSMLGAMRLPGSPLPKLASVRTLPSMTSASLSSGTLDQGLIQTASMRVVYPSTVSP